MATKDRVITVVGDFGKYDPIGFRNDYDIKNDPCSTVFNKYLRDYCSKSYDFFKYSGVSIPVFVGYNYIRRPDKTDTTYLVKRVNEVKDLSRNISFDIARTVKLGGEFERVGGIDDKVGGGSQKMGSDNQR